MGGTLQGWGGGSGIYGVKHEYFLSLIHALTSPYLTLNSTRWVSILVALVNGKNPW